MNTDSKALEHVTSARVDTKALEHVTSARVDTKALEHVTSARVDTKALEHVTSARVDTKALEHVTSASVNAKALEHMTSVSVDNKALEHVTMLSVEMQDTKASERVKYLNSSIPICTRRYDTLNSSFQDVVPRRAYYDNRTLNPGGPRNVVWILSEMLDTQAVEDSVLTCQLNGYYSKANVEREATWWVRKHYPGHTHCNTFIQCVGFPEVAIRSGTFVSIIYKRSMDSCYSRVVTEKALVLIQNNGFSAGKNTIVTCGALYGDPPFFNEWLKYQKALGVDKVHFAVERSFSDNATARYPFLEEALKSGFAEIEVWENFIGDKIYYYSHAIKLQDCALRYTGVYEFAFISDSDDFFIPMKSRKDIDYYTKKLFSNPRLASVHLHWKRYKCNPDPSVYKSLPNGNVTQSLVDYASEWTGNFKSIHRLYAVDIVSVHTEAKRLPGYRASRVDRKLAYVAHMRPDKDEREKPK